LRLAMQAVAVQKGLIPFVYQQTGQNNIEADF